MRSFRHALALRTAGGVFALTLLLDVISAFALRTGLRGVGLDLRCGLHTGEVEMRREEIGGIGVHIGARIMSEAEPNEILVSSTVKDLVVGSGIRFEDRGEHELRGVPEQWHLFAAVE